MPKNNKIKILCLLIIGIVFLYIYGPIAFMKDGLVTRQSVNSFDELYELGPARRHKCENGTRIYIVYFGWSAPKVKKEIVYQKNEETQKQIDDVIKIFAAIITESNISDVIGNDDLPFHCHLLIGCLRKII